MKNVIAIARRELRAAFDLPIAYVTIAAFLALSSVGGLAGFFDRGVADLRDYFTGLRYAFVLFAPAIAMRLWAEERRQGTFELLFTLPVAPWEAVVGKFLGALALVAITLSLGAVLPLSLSPWASFDAGAVFAGYLGALLLAALELALGLVISALTENQIVAFVGGAVASFFLLIAGEPFVLHEAEQAAVPEWLEGARAFAVGVLSRVGTGEHQEGLARGVLDTKDIVYFFAFTSFLLFANTIAVERRRPGKRFEAAIAIALALVAAFLATDLATRARTRFDLTARRTLSLGEGTKNVIEGLDAQLTIRCYLSSDLPAAEERSRRALLDLLDEIEATGKGLVRVELLDPGRDDRLAAQAEREGITKITRQVQQSERVEARLIYCGLTLLYGGKPPVAIPFALYRPNLEYDLAVMIRKLAAKAAQRIAFIGPRGDSRKRLRDELARSYTVEDVDLKTKGEVPKDYGAAILIADAPGRAAVDERALYALDQLVMRGGSLLVLEDAFDIDSQRWRARPVAANPLADRLARYGIKVERSLVFAPTTRTVFLQSPTSRGVVASRFPYFLAVDASTCKDSPIAFNLGECCLPFACPVDVESDKLAPGVTGVRLIGTHPGWATPPGGEVNLDPATPIPTAALGKQAQHIVAAAVQGEVPSAFAGGPIPPPPASISPDKDNLKEPIAKSKGGRVVVVGCTQIATDFWIERYPANLSLLLNAVDWASQDAALAALRARTSLPALKKPESIESAKRIAWGLNLAGLPLALGLLGVARFWFRRRASGKAASRSRA